MSSIPLRFFCPGTSCKKVPKDWCHATDWYNLRINTDGDILCNKGCTPSFIKHWGFKCNDENHHGGYVSYSIGNLLTAVGNASVAVENYFPSTDQSEMMDFLMKLQERLTYRWKYE